MMLRPACLLATLLLAASPAFAQHHGAHAGHAGHAGKAGAATAKAAAKDKPVATTRLTEAHFDALDADKDGFVAKSELPAGHALVDHFSMADRDRDGKLDKREFAALVRMQ